MNVEKVILAAEYLYPNFKFFNTDLVYYTWEDGDVVITFGEEKNPCGILRLALELKEEDMDTFIDNVELILTYMNYQENQ